MATFADFNRFTDGLKEDGQLMPVLFIGHGSPMNGIEDNEFSRRWANMAKEIPVPKAVLVVSAHWLSRGTRITAMEYPKTIHDFGGFPQELFAVQYPAPGHPALAAATALLTPLEQISLDHDWGLDHGTWTVVRHMYPEANIPVLQLSLDYTKASGGHYALAKELPSLRRKGVLIIGSGNMVHNLRMLAWDKINEPEYGYAWAHEMNEQFKQLIWSENHQELIRFDSFGEAGKLAIPTPEHYLPLLYTLALKGDKDEVAFFNDRVLAGSLSMTSVKIG